MMWAYLTFVLIGSVAAQISKPGSCPNIAVKQDFDITKFLDKWYAVQRYPTSYGIGEKCASVTYTANKNGTIGIDTELINSSTGKTTSIYGYATPNEHEKAKLSIVPQIKNPLLPKAVWIVDTDYTSFAVLWDCENGTASSRRFAWLFTREQQPKKSVLEKAYAVFDKNGIDRSPLEVVDQKNCPKGSESSA